MRIHFRRTLALLLSLMLLTVISSAALAEDGFGESAEAGQTDTAAQTVDTAAQDGSVSQVSASTVNLAPGANSVTVSLSDNSYKEDLKQVPLAVELYQVAPAVAVQGYDTYAFDLTALENPDHPFAAIRESLAEEFDRESPDFVAYMTDTLIPFILGEGFTGEAARTGTMTEGSPLTVSGLDAGLYVLVVHGEQSEETEGAAYVRGLNAEGKLVSGSEAAVRQVTVAETLDYTYIFTPQLLSLPTRAGGSATGENRSTNTADSGDWVNSIQVVLKTERESRLGSLEIVKTLNGYIGTDPAVFVFDVEAELNGETVFSDVVTLVFDGDGTKSVTLTKKIPAGATVTVKEVYSGSRYRLETGPDYSVAGETVSESIVEIDRLLSVHFTNTHDGTTPGGGSVVNRFTSDGTGSWQLTNPNDSTEVTAVGGEAATEGGEAS